MKHAITSICSFLTAAAVIAGALYGCQKANDAYYAAESECVSKGGSWIPIAEYRASCVGAKQ